MTNNTSRLSIGDKLRKLRQNKGYSQEYMAERLKISQKTYSNMENEKSTISVDTLKKLAEELDIDLLQLLSDGKVIVQYNTSTDTSTFNGVVNQNFPEEVIETYKKMLEEYKAIIDDLRKQNKLKDDLLDRLTK